MFAIIVSLASAFSGVPTTSGSLLDEPLSCSVGPASRTYAGHKWIVWSCTDRQSVVIVAGPGNPAQPFYFFITPSAEGIELVGEGTGAKSATEPAYLELKKLTTKDLKAMVTETQRK